MALFPLRKYMPGYKTRITYQWKVLIKSNSNSMCLINLQERTFLFSLPVIHRIYLRLKILQQSGCWCWIFQHTTLNWFCAPSISTTQMRKLRTFLAGIYVFQVNNRTIGKGVKYLKVNVKTPEKSHSCLYNVCIVNFEQIPHLVLVFLLLTQNK